METKEEIRRTINKIAEDAREFCRLAELFQEGIRRHFKEVQTNMAKSSSTPNSAAQSGE